jgi:ABC-type Mn2+/Zn2+ transport system permease subunit
MEVSAIVVKRTVLFCWLDLPSLAIVVSLQSVEFILVVPMLVTPGSIAHLSVYQFDQVLAIEAAAAGGRSWMCLSVASRSGPGGGVFGGAGGGVG